MRLLCILILPLFLAACGGGSGSGITFATNDVVGFQVAPSPAGGVNATFGWAEQNYAWVPTETTGGEILQSTIIGADGVSTSIDGLSVLGQFEANADVAATDVTLGRFFGVGQAAVQLATGFRDQLAGSVPE